MAGNGVAPPLKRQGFGRLGIELTKIMVLQYSNQETSVTIGESVRDEDGNNYPLASLYEFFNMFSIFQFFFPCFFGFGA